MRIGQSAQEVIKRRIIRLLINPALTKMKNNVGLTVSEKYYIAYGLLKVGVERI